MKISELHGNSNKEICSSCGKEYLRDFRVRNAVGVHDHLTGRRCTAPGCSGELQDTIINFGESLPEVPLTKGFENAEKADLVSESYLLPFKENKEETVFFYYYSFVILIILLLLIRSVWFWAAAARWALRAVCPSSWARRRTPDSWLPTCRELHWTAMLISKFMPSAMNWWRLSWKC